MSSDSWRAAVTGNDLPQVKHLAGADPELLCRPMDGVSPLMQALYHRAIEVADWLRGYAIELTVHEAAALGDVEALNRILGGDLQGAGEVAADGFTPLHLAAFFGRPDAVRFLLEEGADPDAVAANPTSVRPVHSAVASRDDETLRAVLAGRPDVNAKQAGGFTALHAAAMHGNEAMVTMLLEAGADTGVAADDGRNAAEFAREGGYHDLAERLA